MPDSLDSVIARIVTRIEALLHLGSTVHQYLSNIKDPITDYNNIINEINSIYEILSTLQANIQNNSINNEDWSIISQRLEGSDGPLNLLKTALQELTTKFEDTASTIDVRVLPWDFKQNEAEQLFRFVTKQRSLLSLALRNNYVAPSTDIHDNTLPIRDDIENTNLHKRYYTNHDTTFNSQYQDDKSRYLPETQSKRQRINRQGNFTNADGSQFIASNLNSGGGSININTHTLENRCLIDLRTTDPRLDKRRIEETKGGLLDNVYNWIFDNSDFQQWHFNRDNRLLWIKGDPGKGKTMLLCGIINELQRSDETALAYFFCQGTDARINSAVAVLRGLIYMLLDRQPVLLSHLQKRYEKAKEQLFKDANTFIALSEILKDILHDKNLKPTILIIDALDECQKDLPQLLRLIVSGLSISSRVKWLVSSRNWPEIEEQLQQAEQGTRLSLELNAESVSAAVRWYIREKVKYLARTKKYTTETKDTIERYLLEHANGTFLWVALVCQNLEKARLFTNSKLQDYPSELDPLYNRMMEQIVDMEDIEAAQICLQILAIVVIAYRPLTLDELISLMEMNNGNPLEEIIQLCGSFLVSRNRSIFFVHQSAQDFLSKKVAGTIFPDGIGKVHNKALLNSITVMRKTLKRDIYGLGYPGFPIDKVKQPDPDTLASIRYSCIYWINHLRDGGPEQNGEHIQDNGNIYEFLKNHLLHWLEVMSLMEKTSEGINAISSLESYILANKGSELYTLIHDAKRFVLYNRIGIEQAPLQIYCSALFFAPENSIIRKTFQEYIPSWIYKISRTRSNWSAALQTLEGHSDSVTSVAFSPDGTKVASGSDDKTIRLWDTVTGESLQTLEGHSNPVTSVAFSPDGTKVASGSDDKTIRLWDIVTGESLQTLEGHSNWVTSVAFSPDGTKVASGSEDKTIRLWDAVTGESLQTLEGHSNWVTSVAFSPDGTKVASGSDDKTIRLWDTVTGESLQTLEGHSNRVTSLAFSPDGTKVASSSFDDTVRLWDAVTGESLQTLEGHSDGVSSLAFSPDGTKVASGSFDDTVRLWDAVTGELLQTLEGHSNWVTSVAFSPDGTKVASGSDDKTIRLWDAVTGESLQTLEGHSDGVSSLAFSPDGTKVASGSFDDTVRLWDAVTGESLQTLEGHLDGVSSVAFSPDGTKVASGSFDKTIRLWDIVTGESLQTLEGHSNWVTSVAFSPDGTKVASGSEDKTIRLWDAVTGESLQTLEGHSNWVTSVAFSPDGTKVASGSDDDTVRLWDAVTGELLQTLEGHSNRVTSVAFSPDGTKVASGSFDKTIRLWDIVTGESLQTLEGHS
ncbi:hypothetical protein sscle_16g107810 [Sclerotinia sclerotiorum 1980 UF-70]|uniref:Mitochondrial division protein 1 n=1 Tax=Sclerotinia sclerotiorum (strain ATCC 18683 / 1980 / Ss-1) TaxID=665079 RepID=A0A1D9QM67_SCLS1|nr:hypothetical protein sscle_16g107810 [Sclerotinia sclerotiorum 1980 UF-70]